MNSDWSKHVTWDCNIQSDCFTSDQSNYSRYSEIMHSDWSKYGKWTGNIQSDCLILAITPTLKCFIRSAPWADPIKNLSVNLCYTDFKAFWLAEKFEQPISVLKNEQSVKLWWKIPYRIWFHVVAETTKISLTTISIDRLADPAWNQFSLTFLMLKILISRDLPLGFVILILG